MSQCLVTGATGFLGRQLVQGLLQQGHQLVLLVRRPDIEPGLSLIASWYELVSELSNGSSLVVLQGDLVESGLGLSEEINFSNLKHVYHLAAIYDLSAGEEQVLRTNVQGTENLFERLTHNDFSGRFHMVSSIAVAGDYKGCFNESMFDEGQAHSHVYHLSKFQSEACARRYRDTCQMDVFIYRPAAVVGHSKTGEIDKIDGPYYMFLLVSFLKRWLPSWFPLVIPKLRSTLDIVPQDYVIEAILALSQSDSNGEQYCFHLSGPEALSLHEIFRQVLRSADGPKISFALPLNMFSKQGVKLKPLAMMKQLKAFHLLLDGVLDRFGIPRSVFEAMMPDVAFSASKTQQVLSKLQVDAPPFSSYVDQLWDYYNRKLDPVKNRESLARQVFKGKRVMITGGSSGIGFASAKRAVSYGASVVLVARHQEKLDECREVLLGLFPDSVNDIDVYACDISDLEACDSLVTYVEQKFGSVDIFFSNAGRSIRRSISRSEGRFHDLERTMQLNYYGAARLILGLLPSMVTNGGGHILHSSSMGTMAVTPRFGPYMASKAALDSLCDSIAAEFVDRHIHLTSIKFPLVKTSMVAPTEEYKEADLASPDFAAQMFIDAVIDKPRKQMTGMGVFLGTMSLYAPALVTQIYNYLYQIWPDEKGEFSEMVVDRALLTSVVPHSPL